MVRWRACAARMTAIDALAAWASLPIDAIGRAANPLTLAGFGFAFGAAHGLLPGHGKALLAARHVATGRDAHGAPAALALPLLDGLLLAGTRTLIAFALVVGSVEASRRLGLAIPVRGVRIAAGGVLIAFALQLAWRARIARHVRSDPDLAAIERAGLPSDTGMNRSTFDRSLMVLALAPEPMALAIASFGMAQGDLRAAASVALGLALGVGATLGVAAALAQRGTDRLITRAAFARIGFYAEAAVAAILALSGGILVASAW